MQSDNPDNEKSNFDIDKQGNDNDAREYVSSPGYDTSSTHPPSSPDLCEYTYEGAIQDYKSRVSRAQKCGFTNNFYAENHPKDSNHEPNGQTPRKQTSAEIENRLSNFQAKTSNESEKSEGIKENLPKVDIARRRELFEKEKVASEKKDVEKAINHLACDFSQTLSIKERLMNLESRNDSHESSHTKVDYLSGEIGSVKDRLLDIESQASIHQTVQPEKHALIDVPITSLKDRLQTVYEMVPSTDVDTNNMAISEEEASEEVCEEVCEEVSEEITAKMNNENINNNNHVTESMEENFVESTTNEVLPATVDQSPVDDIVAEQPNRLLSTINEAIHRVEDQPEKMANRDASVSSTNLFVNHSLDDNVVDCRVIDDVDDDTNRKSYLVMDGTSVHDIVNTSRTDDTAGDEVLTSGGESLCISSSAIISDCCRQQSINNEIFNKIDVMYLRSPMSVDDNASSSPVEILPPNGSDVLPQNGEIKLSFSVDSNNSSVHSTETFVQTEQTVPLEIPFDLPDSPSKESSESKNNRIKCQIVGVLEKHKCPGEPSASRSDLTLNTLAIDCPSPDQSLQSSQSSPSKSPYKSSKTIFDFIKRNLLNDASSPTAKDDEVNSTFYVPLIDDNESENQKPLICSYDREMVDESTEINCLIDEELEKLD